MKEIRLAVLSGVMLASALAFTPAFADTGYGGHGGSGTHGSYTSHYVQHFIRHQKEIGLNDEQVSKLKTLSLEWDKTRIKSLADIEIAEREADAMMHDEKADLAAIESKLKDAAMKEVNLRVTALKMRRDARTVLTPEQREKDKAEHQKKMEQMGEHEKQEHARPN
jgi:periplasmic protein CpxP/Spy